MNLDFGGRIVMVTGGTGALGSAVVDTLVRAGATCHVTCLKSEELARFPFREHPQVRVHTNIDLADERTVDGLYAACAGASPLWASIHIAGGFAMSPIERTAKADFDSLMQSNAASCFLCCREAIKRFAPTGGRIVNVAARPGLMPELGADMVAYTASKAAVAAITQALAAEVAPRGIWVNAVVPSIMDTPANRLAMPDADHSRWAKLDEVAATIAFLASPDNRATRGALVPVYGRA
ncbi:MAG: SDR family NAD(P)-dependent oxidoreductase [Phycisphaeraceae bacterium]|nr:SDR family NAD(P)-dependent oxidoreductase [Phycisphaeraceae bacterium]